ncbi:MAG: NADH-quinone oxidoreductase subunit NuoH [Candidatus Promineifilaceae bacterium]|jgi:NADH-quinone oxidoreductase subunit H
MNPFKYASQIPELPTISPLLRDIIVVVVISTFLLLIAIVLIWLMRKVIARMQKRVGPNRVGGRYGLLQPIADVMKLLSKEQIVPAGADRLAYELAPVLIVVASLLVWAVMPFGPGLIGVDLNIGLFYIMAISSISVVTFLLAGWGSNNKYALLGAFRAVAQLVSYEVPFILATLIPILLARSMSTVAIVESQTVPFLFVVPLAAVIFFISSLAETGTTPFDLLEAESEIVAGFHIEYSGMKFAMFYLAEFLGALFMSALFATVFLGGWNIPLINLMLSLFGVQSIDLSAMGIAGSILGLIVFLIKTFFIYFIFLWIRATWPRVRVDQILSLNWKILVPISLVLILVVAVLDKMIPEGTNDLVRAGILLASNVLIAFVALEIMRRNGRQRRELIVDSGLVESGKQEVVEAAPLH